MVLYNKSSYVANREQISVKSVHISPDAQLQKSEYFEKIDSEYVRCGTASIFMFTEPLGRWRHAYALKHQGGERR